MENRLKNRAIIRQNLHVVRVLMAHRLHIEIRNSRDKIYGKVPNGDNHAV